MSTTLPISRTMEEERHHGTQPAVKVVDRRWWAQKEAVSAAAPTEAGAETPADTTWAPGKPTYVEELERRIADKDREIAELLSRYREAARQFDDSRARLRKDVAKEIERGRRTLLVELLDVVDNLDRAIDAARGTGEAAALLQGVEMVRQLFLAKLDGFGVTRLDPLGEAFDASQHEAMTTVPTDDPSQDHVIVGVLAPGYVVGGEVLRPARVAVARSNRPVGSNESTGV